MDVVEGGGHRRQHRLAAARGNAQAHARHLRAKGVKAGLVKLRLWRPFPFEELKAVIGNAKKLIVTDRACSFGGPGGPVFSEIKSALYAEARRPLIYNYIIGLGGRDVQVKEFVGMFENVLADTANKAADTYEFWGVRE